MKPADRFQCSFRGECFDEYGCLNSRLLTASFLLYREFVKNEKLEESLRRYLPDDNLQAVETPAETDLRDNM